MKARSTMALIGILAVGSFISSMLITVSKGFIIPAILLGLTAILTFVIAMLENSQEMLDWWDSVVDGVFENDERKE